MRGAAHAAALSALLLAPAALSAEAGAAAERAELVRQIDRVLANPASDAAKVALESSVGRAAAAEKADAEAERAKLMAAAEKDYAKLAALRAAKAERVNEWEDDFSRACSLASGAATVRRAVDEYERLLSDFPVYSDTGELLRKSGEKIRGIFYATIKKAYPYLAEGRTTADSRMLASLQFARSAAQQSATGGGTMSRVAERELRRADKLKRLEEEVTRQQENMAAGLALFRRRRWAEAGKNFDAVLAFDKANEEALYYKGLARGRAAAESETR
ncbi:MAG: hypothetical protein A2X32_12335 [Elusimicrobia bacterium GWC2_64_44]|nr:MAG: hypothetical protein A2X32_12335 [Elusimicrobia bacterium GWC2_64_44]